MKTSQEFESKEQLEQNGKKYERDYQETCNLHR